MGYRLILSLCILFAACHPPNDDAPAGMSGEDLSTLDPQFNVTKTRLLNGVEKHGKVYPLVEDGQVISKEIFDDGTSKAKEEGDSAIFTGLSLLMLSCEEAEPLLKTLIRNIHLNNGMVPRHHPQTDPEFPTSRDQTLGVMVGFVDMHQRCPQFRPEIEVAWRLHYLYVKERQGDLGPGTGNNLGSMHWLWDKVSMALGASNNATDKGYFESGLVATAIGILANKEACYPIHLGTWQIILAGMLDSPVNKLARREYCYVTSTMHLPLTDKLCGRTTAKEWLSSKWKPNEYHYAHQRCPAWEGPDGNGWEHPWTDWLVMYWLGTHEY